MAQMGQMGPMAQMGQMGPMAQMGQMGPMAQMGQMGQSEEASDKIKELEGFVKIFDFFKPENLNNMIGKLRNINSSKFDAIEELKGIEKKKKFELVKLKYVAKFVNSLEKNDIQKFISKLALPIPKQEGVQDPLNSMGLGNSMSLDMYTVKDITSIFMDINDDMYNLIQDFVNDQIKFVKKAQNQGNFTEAIDVRLIPKLLNILDQLTIANLDKIINIVTTKFGVAIPIRGFQIKILVKSLKIIFPLKNQAKLTSNIKNDMRYFVSSNNLNNENKGTVDKFKEKLKDKEFIKLLSKPLLKYNQISNHLKNHKELCLLVILLINTFYLTHNIKLYDIDKIKSIYGTQRKIQPNISLEIVKKQLKNQIVLIYKRFIYTKGLIILLSKCALDYYYQPKDSKFFHIFFHIIYSFNESNNSLNIYHQEFDYNLYLKNIQSETFKNSLTNYNLEENFINVCKTIFGSTNNEIDLNSLLNIIYHKAFKNKEFKSTILELNNSGSYVKFRTSENSNNIHKYKVFNEFFNKIMKKKYIVYISDENVSTLRLNKSVNITKPVYLSLHELSLSEYNSVNKFLLRANLNSNSNKTNSNRENEENELNGENIVYTKEELKELTKLIKKKMYNNSELNKLIRNKNNSIYNSFELINKMKDLYTFEAFILMIFKTFYKNIFYLLTKNLDPLAKEALTKI
jgi:hypothetical protein